MLWEKIRQDLLIVVALSVGVAALVLALRAGEAADGSGPIGVQRVAASDAAAAGVTVAAFQPKGHTIAIQDFSYDPDPVRAEAGQAVVWENYDEVPHTVTAKDGSWDSGTLAQGDAVIMVFDQPGTYAYICLLHPPGAGAIAGAPEGAKLAGGGGRPMQGTIIVEE
jgi:plastocyanin